MIYPHLRNDREINGRKLWRSKSGTSSFMHDVGSQCKEVFAACWSRKGAETSNNDGDGRHDLAMRLLTNDNRENDNRHESVGYVLDVYT